MASDPSTSRGSAFGRPGLGPTWSSATKDGVGTAYSTSSRVWFTLARGILTEIYYPTIDHPQIRDAQFLVSDGETFFHEERRDLPSEVVRLEAQTLGYHVTSRDPDGRYRLEKEIITDPHASCVLIRARLVAPDQWAKKLHVYFLLAPHLEVGGHGNSAAGFNVAGHKVLVAWKNGTFLTLGCDRAWARTSCGFVGASDGWQDLHDNFKMDWEFDRAEDGNVAIMGEISLAGGMEFTVGIAFGRSQHAATAKLNQSLAIPFAQHRARFIDQWQRVSRTMVKLDPVSCDGGHLYRSSRTLLMAHEDKTFAGALIASASIPWGDAMGDEDLGGYHLVWVRDMVNSATALMATGDMVTPLRALVYLACSQQADGGFPQNFWIDGTPYWKAVQLDEVAFPIMLAWRLWKAEALQEFDPYPMVRAAARFLVERGAVTQQERWEEVSGLSPSTLAACIAALICAADFARSRGESAEAQFLEDHADFLESHVEHWTVTSQGSLLDGVSRHYIRILPAGVNDPAPDENPNLGTVTLTNQPPGERSQFPAKDIVDAGFLELVRYGVRRAGDSLMEDSLRVIDAVLKVQTPYGAAWRRYNHDGYGPGADGKPYIGYGVGRAWPLLGGERGHYELAAGRDVKPFIAALENFASLSGLLPEQVWDQPDLPAARMIFGKSSGSAMPLVWAHAEYIKLLRSVNDRKVFDLIPAVAERYLQGRGKKNWEVWKPNRRVRKIAAGSVLRVLAPGRFRVRWTLASGDGSAQESASSASGLGLDYLDLTTSPGRAGALRFSFLDADPSLPKDAVQEVMVEDRKP